MNPSNLQTFLAWCTGINYALLLGWFAGHVLAHDWLHRTHSRWFRLSRERFDEIHYAGMAVYKIGIILFFLVPLLAVTAMLR